MTGGHPASGSWGRFAAIVLILAVVMPGIGFAVVLGLIALLISFGPTSLFRFRDILEMLASVAYGVGAIPAALVGVAVALRDRRGGASRRFVMLAGLIGGLVFALTLLVVAFDRSIFFVAMEIMALVLAVLGSLAAWALARPLLRRGRSSLPGVGA